MSESPGLVLGPLQIQPGTGQAIRGVASRQSVCALETHRT